TTLERLSSAERLRPDEESGNRTNPATAFHCCPRRGAWPRTGYRQIYRLLWHKLHRRLSPRFVSPAARPRADTHVEPPIWQLRAMVWRGPSRHAHRSIDEQRGKGQWEHWRLRSR